MSPGRNFYVNYTLRGPEQKAVAAALKGRAVLNATRFEFAPELAAGESDGLSNLNISYNQINDIGPLASLTKLETLGMSLNQISDLSPLSALPLHVLYADTNQITDITPLVTIPTFVEASQLDVRQNPLDCAAQAENLAALAARGVFLQSDCQ